MTRKLTHSFRMLWMAAILLAAGVALFASPPEPAQADHLAAPGNVTVTAQVEGLAVSWDRVAVNASRNWRHYYYVRWRVKEPQGPWLGTSGPYFGIRHGDPGCTGTCSLTVSNAYISSAAVPDWAKPSLLVSGTTYEVQVATYGSYSSFGTNHYAWSGSVEGTPTAPKRNVEIYFDDYSRSAFEVDRHGLRYAEVYTFAINPPLESDSAVHLRVKPNSTAAYYKDYTIAQRDGSGVTDVHTLTLVVNADGDVESTVATLRLPAGASEASFGMAFEPDGEKEVLESVFLELMAIEDAPYTLVDDYLSDKYMDVEVVIFDNSRPIPEDADPERGIDIQPESVMTGTTGTVSYTVALASMPDSDVTVKAYLDDPYEGAINIGSPGNALSVSPASLTFTSSNWSTPQTFTVTPKSDAYGETYLVLHGLTSDDEDYDTNYWFKGPGIAGQTHITISVAVGGL